MPVDPNRFSVGRVIAIVLPLLVIAAILVHAAEVYRDLTIDPFWSDWLRFNLSAGVPPPLAVALFVPVLLLFAAMPALRRRWSVSRGELVVIFSIFVLAVPILGPGLWHHLVPLQLEFHRQRLLKEATSISANLWPNAGNVLERASVEDQPVAGVRWNFSSDQTMSTEHCPPGGISGGGGGGEGEGEGGCLKIVHASDADVSVATLQLDQMTAPRSVQPLARYMIWTKVRLDEPSASAKATLWAGTSAGHGDELARIAGQAKPGVLAPDRFEITGTLDYQMPQDVGDQFLLKLTFQGQGTLWARDFTIIDTEAVYRYLEGYEEATEENYEKLSEPQRDLVRRRPEASSPLQRAMHVLTQLAPWRAWSRPLGIWGLLILAVFLSMFCLITIFYRHWERADRLPFPLPTFVLDLTKGDEQGRLLLLKSTPFWIGLLACAVHLSLQEASRYIPDLPHLSLKLELSELLPFGPLHNAIKERAYSPPLRIDVRPLYVAVAFFMSLEMLRSLVLFYVLGWVYRITGYFTPLKTVRWAGVYGGPVGYPFPYLLAAGGLGFMAMSCLFGARKHLAAVAGKVFLGRSAVDDSNEALSYRWASAGLLVAVGLMIVFAHFAELNPWFVVVFLAMNLLLALSAARIRAETGLPHTGIMVAYPQYVLSGFGSALVYGFREVSFTAQAYFLYMGTFLMTAPILAEAMAAANRVGVPLKKLARCLLIGFLVAVVTGGVVSMSWAYTVGALSMNRIAFNKGGHYTQMKRLYWGDDHLLDQHFREHPEAEPIVTPQLADSITGFQPVTLAIMGSSFVITGLLTLARVIWLGFGLHPLGFALAFTPALDALWASIGVAFVVKSLGLRFGGVDMIRRVLRPFFVGVFVAELLTIVLWRMVDLLVHGAGGV